MNREKEIALNHAVDKVYELGFGLGEGERLEDYFSEKLMIIGTTVFEKFFNYDGLRTLIKNQQEQSRDIDFKYKRKEIFRNYRADGNVAIIAEDLIATFIVSGETISADIRTSLVLAFEDDRWRLVHWHASKPEMVQSEADTFGIDEWKQKTADLEKLIEERTAELSNKNRELEIESSLERVRTVAMGMQKADDLLKVSEMLYKELVALGFDEIRNALVQTFVDGENYFLDYDYSDQTGGCKSHIALAGHSTVERFVREIRESKADFTELALNRAELDKWKEFRKANNEADDPRLDNISALYYYCYSIGNGSMGISTFSPISNEKRELLKRFRNVFDFAYRRYTDVARAEAQSREAQIEAALEKVRSRSLAMHRSNELEEVIMVVSEQLQQLKFRFHNVSFVRYDEKNGLNFWLATPARRLPFLIKVPYLDNPIYTRPLEARNAGIDFIADVLTPEENHQWLEHLVNNAEQSGFSEEDKASLLNTASFARSLVLMKNIILVVGNYAGIPYSEEQNLILRRFANVFDQSYTRFLDLQKAETQAREAQIETALEKVRSRSLAMHRSDELQDVIDTLFDRLMDLNIEAATASILVTSDDMKVTDTWIQNAAHNYSSRVQIPFVENSVISNDFKFALTNKQDMFSRLYSKADKDLWFGVLLELPGINKIPEDRKEFIREAKAYVVSFAATRHGGIYMGRFTGQLFDDRENEVLKRFSKVFEQAYVRFLDLKTAEEQAREAQIEAALEKVRSRSLAMHRSDELQDIVNTLFERLAALGIKADTGAILNHNNETHDTESWIQNAAHSFSTVHLIPFKATSRVSREIVDFLENGEGLFTVIYSKEEKDKWFTHLFETGLKNLPEDRKQFVLGGTHQASCLAKTRNGGIFLSRYYDPAFSDEEQVVIKRFARVFEQAYIRFLDLQRAEAQTREAQIEVSLERVRARAMAMHKSEDLHNAVAVVFEELDKLKLGVSRVGISVLNKEKRCGNVWLTSIDEGKAVQVYGDESFDIHPLLKGAMDAWINKQDFYYILEGEDLVDYYKAVEEAQFRLPASQMLSTSGTNLQQSCFVAVYNSGGLFAFRDGQFPDEAKQIMRRFASVFDLTYQRFLDLQRAEAQTREAQIEASLERVRGKAMAMHSSQDLADTIGAFYRELKSFSITPRRCGVGLLNKESRSGELFTWNTTETGESLELVGRLVMEGHPVLNGVYENWLTQTEYHPVLRGNEISEYYRTIRPQIDFPEYANDAIQFGYFFFFPEGGVYAWTQVEMSELELEIYRRFTSVLSLTYKRYKDLQQAEALAQQAEIDLIKLKEEKKRTEEALAELKNTQKQLIQSEKMASLGELTAGIAHEIQNPLNFVNNFSEVSNELIDEMMQEVSKGNYEEAKAIAEDVKQNLEKINHHGKRADGIVKGMLQHSRTSSSQKELTDINILADEYLRLAYHGLRAKDKSFNAKFETDLDTTLDRISIMPQEIGRVVLNLINNAFYAVSEKKKKAGSAFEPKVSISTKKVNDRIEVRVKDNGSGIPSHLIDKIFQPFFTTKPTGEGTGLGLSLSYDLVKAHGGDLKVETKEEEGSTFIIQLPV